MIRLGKIMGIEIIVNYSWFIIIALITWSLAVGVFPQLTPGLSPTLYVIMGLIAGLLLFASVLLHELTHSYVARRNGLPVNSIVLFIFGGASQLTEEPKEPGVEFRMAIAGPLMSFFLAAVFLAATVAGQLLNFGPFFFGITSYLWIINLILAVFNLVPGFPLDGGRVLRSILWKAEGNLRRATRQASIVGQSFGYLLIAGGIYFLFSGAVIGGIWFVFIGWFLAQAAAASYQQLLVTQVLERVDVSDVMTPDPKTVPADITIRQLVDDYFLKYHYGGFPVMDDGRPVGIVSLADVKDIPREAWETEPVREAARPVTAEVSVGPHDDVSRALSKMTQHEVGRLAVLESGRLVGLVTRSDVMRYLQTHPEAEAA
ncbi:MAG: CBS domain-containing protein [Actinobacteria bacterium]|nr:MAG: CBS domain-containing protein [Actinomycetota bacterium]